MGIFSKIKNALKKTRDGLAGALSNLFSKNKLGSEFYDELEEILIGADISVTTAEEVVEELQRHTNGKKQKDKVKKINVSEKKQYATIFQQLSFQAMQWFERNFDEIHGGF